MKVPPKVRNFMWMLAISRIPTKDFLVQRGVRLDLSSCGCPWCDRVTEEVNHLFFTCPFIVSFWSRIFVWWNSDRKTVSKFDEFFALCWCVPYEVYKRVFGC